MKKLLTVMLLLLAGTAWGGNFEDGVAAYSKNNYSVAIVKFKLAATQGDASAQYNIGFMYDNGQGVVQDYAEALKWYKLAAAQGDADAQFNIGFMYSNGRGVVQDDAEAFEWFKLAAAQDAAGGVKGRDIVAAKMSSKQISAAQKLFRKCKASHFKHCD